MTIFDLIVEDILAEISPEQAYTNFYNNIPREEFDQIVTANGKFDGLVKFLLNEYLGKNTTLEECLELIKKYKSIDNKARITISDKIKGKEYDSIDELIYDLTHTEEITRLSKSSLIKNGYVEIGRIENWIISATLTYEANRKHFGHTEWCTASDRLGRFDGYKQFFYYTAQANSFLIQVTDIKDKNKTYQIQVRNDGMFGQICDVKDNSMNHVELKEALGENVYTSLRDLMRNKCVELWKATSEMFSTEEEFQKSREKYLDDKIKRRQIKIRKLHEESKQLNMEICKETENKYNEFKEKRLYENLDFLNSLLTLDKIYEVNDINKIEEYFSTHNNTVIIGYKEIGNGIIIAPIIVKVPYYYNVDEDSVSIKKITDYNNTSWWDFGDTREYVTKGVVIVGEYGDEHTLFKSIIRVAFNINCIGGFFFDNYVSEQLEYKAILFNANVTKGILYLPSNGKAYGLVTTTIHYSVIRVGENTILQNSNQYFVFSKDLKEVIDYECSRHCSSEGNKIVVLSHANQNYSTLYADNEVLEGGKFVFDEKIEFITNQMTITNGIFTMVTTFKGRNIGVIIDSKRNSVYTVFDRKDDNRIPIFCDGDSLVYTKLNDTSLMYFDIRTQEYFKIENGEKEKCDVYGNPIGQP